MKIRALFMVLSFSCITSLNSSAATYFSQSALTSTEDGYWEGNTKTYDLGTGEYIYSPTSGCGPVTMAMVLNSQVDSSITPVNTIEFVLRNSLYSKGDGGSAFGIASSFAKSYNLSYETAYDKCGLDSKNKQMSWIYNHLKEGHWIVANVGTNYKLKGGSPKLFFNKGHYVGFYGLDNKGNAICYDPGNKERNGVSVPIEIVWGDSRSDSVNKNSLTAVWNSGKAKIYKTPVSDVRKMYAVESEVISTVDSIDRLLNQANRYLK